MRTIQLNCLKLLSFFIPLTVVCVIAIIPSTGVSEGHGFPTEASEGVSIDQGDKNSLPPDEGDTKFGGGEKKTKVVKGKTIEELVDEYRLNALENGHTFVEPEDLSFEEIFEGSDKNYIRYYWHTMRDEGTFFDSFISERRRDKADEEGSHYSLIYKLETTKDFKRMYRYLDQLPSGKYFELSPEIIIKTHEIGNRTQKSFQSFVSTALFNLPAGFLFKPGQYKKRRNQLSIDIGISPKQYSNLLNKLDELIDLGVFTSVTPENRKHYELRSSLLNPAHRAGSVYKGWLLYPSPQAVEQALIDISNWVNFHLKKWFSGDKTGYDPIYIAVVAKHAIAYIHPFVDGNGRASRAIKDKILDTVGLLHEDRNNMYHDLDLTIEEDYKLTKLGLKQQINDMKDNAIDAADTAAEKYGLNEIDDSVFYYLKKKFEGISVWYLRSRKQVLTFGEKKEKDFFLNRSGFFVDETGVAYTLEPNSLEQGRPKLVPLADNTLVLYSWGGKAQYTPSRVFSRDTNIYHWQAVRENIKLLNQLDTQPSLARKVDVENYETIQKSNENGTFYFYPWQRDMLLNAIEIKEDPVKDPLAVLNPFNGRNKGAQPISYFDQLHSSGADEIHWDFIIAQSMRLDIFYRRLERYVTKHHPSWETYVKMKVYESRKKIHQAVRTSLGDLFPKLEALFVDDFKQQKEFLDEKAWRYLRQQKILIGMYQYIRHTHFWYSDFDEGVKKVPQNLAVLIRSSSAKRMEQWGGLVSDNDIGQAIRKWMPFIETAARDIQKYIVKKQGDQAWGEGVPLKSLSAEDAKNFDHPFTRWAAKIIFSNEDYQNKLRSFLSEIMANPYQNRGLELEFEREFTQLLLHWQGVAPKFGMSLTTRPGFSFTQYSPGFGNDIGDGALFIVQVPIDKARVSYASNFENESEITTMDPIINIGNTRHLLTGKKFILYKSQTQGPMKDQEIISTEDAQKNGIIKGDMNFVIHDGDVPEEAKAFLRRTFYFSKGVPEDIDSRHFTISSDESKPNYDEGVEHHWGDGEGYDLEEYTDSPQYEGEGTVSPEGEKIAITSGSCVYSTEYQSAQPNAISCEEILE